MNRRMLGKFAFNAVLKALQLGSYSTKKQMAFTPAVAGAEPRGRRLQSHLPGQDTGPLVFPAFRIVGEPDAAQGRGRPQIVDMPARTLADSPVVIAARRHPARTEGAADVEIPAARQYHAPETADFELEPPGAVQEQQIGAGAAVGLAPLQCPGPLSAMWER